jgi:DNA-binding response OmpR family regulator
MRLLVVDDDSEVRDLLIRALERDRHTVTAVATMAAARTVLYAANIDLVVLDLALPDGSGIELCRELGASRNTVPVLMLTARSEVRERVRALDAGADDFLGKPFAIAELRARVRALARRSLGASSGLPWQNAELTIDFTCRRALRKGVTLAFTAREWLILETLAQHQGRVVRRSELLERGWGEATDASAASLEVLVGRIRRKLGDNVIRTLRGEGYSLEAP